MKIQFTISSINKMIEVVKVLSKDTYTTLDICTGIQGNKMANKLSVTNGERQLETSIITDKAKDIEDGDYSILNPVEKITMKSSDFVDILSKITLLNRDVVADVKTDGIDFSTVDKKAKLKVPRVENDVQKNLIPTRYNSMDPSQFDPAVLMARLNSEEFMNMAKNASIFQDTMDYIFKIQSAAEKTVEQDGEEKIVSNGSLQLLTTNGNAISNAVFDVAIDKPEAVAVFEEGGKEPTAVAFNEFVKQAFECDFEEKGIIFDATVDVVKELLTLAMSSNGCCDLMIGAKYISVSVNGLDTIYTAPIKQNKLTALDLYNDRTQMMLGLEKVELNKEDLLNGLKLASAYDKDKTVMAKPVTFLFKKSHVTVAKADAAIEIALLKGNDELNVKFGFKSAYLEKAISSVSSEKVEIYFNGNGEPMWFVKGSASSNGYLILGCKI